MAVRNGNNQWNEMLNIYNSKVGLNVLVILIIVTALCGRVLGQTPTDLPNNYIGRIVNANPGDSIYVYIGENEYSHGVVDTTSFFPDVEGLVSNVYFVQIPPDDSTTHTIKEGGVLGDTLNFKIGINGKQYYLIGVNGETPIFQSGKVTRLDFYIGTETFVYECGYEPITCMLNQNYPNPFNSETVITYRLTNDSVLDLVVYDLKGRKIKKLFYGNKGAGIHKVNFNGNGLQSGVYILSMTVGDKRLSKKIIYQK